MSTTVRDALAKAAQSLEAIATQAGRYDFMEGLPDIRAYARNRALVARAALAQSEAQPVAWRAPDGELREDEGQGEPPFNDWTPLYASPQQAQPAEPAYVPLSEFQRMRIIGDEFPIALVQPIIIQKIDAVCLAIERAVRGQT